MQLEQILLWSCEYCGTMCLKAPVQDICPLCRLQLRSWEDLCLALQVALVVSKPVAGGPTSLYASAWQIWVLTLINELRLSLKMQYRLIFSKASNICDSHIKE